MSLVDPIEILENDYQRFLEDIKPDKQLMLRCERFYKTLYTYKPVAVQSSVANADLRSTYRRARLTKQTHDAAVQVACNTYRSHSVAYLRASNESIAQTLKKVERTYFAWVKRHKDKPLISYDVMTEEEIRQDRGDDSKVFLRFHGNTEAILILSSKEWADYIEEYESSLKKAKELSMSLSKKIVEWEKYGDDKRRLWIAIVALFVTVVLFMIGQTIILIRAGYYNTVYGSNFLPRELMQDDKINTPDRNTVEAAKRAALLTKRAAIDAGLPPADVSAAEAVAIGTVVARRNALGG